MDSVDSRISTTGSGVPRRLRDALGELATADRLLIALDFDGTLAPTVDDPAKARALPAARTAVERLGAISSTRVALVSGRALESLEEVAKVDDTVLLIGSHGIELRLDSAEGELLLDDEELANLDRLSEVLDQVADSVDRVWIESKPAGFALHTRLATERHSRVAHLIATSEARAEVPDLKVREGKDVVEFSVRSTTKGEAVEHLRRYTKSSAVFYAGDDVTDEDVFVTLRADDLGVKSGPGITAADHRVAGPEEVAKVLTLLANLREAWAESVDPSN